MQHDTLTFGSVGMLGEWHRNSTGGALTSTERPWAEKVPSRSMATTCCRTSWLQNRHRVVHKTQLPSSGATSLQSMSTQKRHNWSLSATKTLPAPPPEGLHHVSRHQQQPLSKKFHMVEWTIHDTRGQKDSKDSQQDVIDMLM